jgi:hypothetical protein
MSVMLEAVRPIELSEILLAERIEHGETSPLIEQVFSVAAAWANGALLKRLSFFESFTEDS